MNALKIVIAHKTFRLATKSLTPLNLQCEL